MKTSITEMSVGEILVRGTQLLIARLPYFLVIELIVQSPILALQLLLPDLALNLRTQSLIIVLPWIVLGPLGSAAILRVITQDYLARPVGLGDAFQFAIGRFLPLLGTSILFGIGVMLGFCACIIPGIYFFVLWGFYAQVVVMENESGSGALGRSKELVAGYFGRVFGVLFLLYFFVGIVNALLPEVLGNALPFAVVAPGVNPMFPEIRIVDYANYVIVQLTITAASTVLQTYIAICTTLMYFDLRNRKEAYNVEHIAAWFDQYRSWRDEPDVDLPPPIPGAPPPATGIKPADGGAPSPDAGIKEGKPESPGSGAAPPT